MNIYRRLDALEKSPAVKVESREKVLERLNQRLDGIKERMGPVEVSPEESRRFLSETWPRLLEELRLRMGKWPTEPE
jgi:hypothetical protein